MKKLMCLLLCLSFLVAAMPLVAAEGEKDELVVAYPVDPGNLSPFGTNSSQVDFIVYQIYEALFKVNDADGSIVPQIMDNYTLSEDGLTYTFNLKQGIKDTNGNEITASDVLFSFELCSKSPMAINTLCVDFDNTKVIDDYTFQLAVLSPSSTYMSQFAKIYIVDEQSYAASTDGFISTPVGTGPYKLENWTQGTTVTLTYNEDYHGAEPQVKKLVFKVIGEASQRTTALMTCEADINFDYLVTDANYINDSGTHITEDRPTNVVYAMYFNCDEGKPTSDINLRKAIALAVDNEALTSVVYFGHNTPATTCESKSCYDYDESWEGNECYQYDLEKAKEYLAQSSYDGSPLTIITKSNVNSFDKLAEAVQNQLKQLGVNVEIVQYDPATITTVTLEQPENWDINLSDHMTPSNYAVDSVNTIHVRRNYPHISDEMKQEFSDVTSVALSTTDHDEMIEYASKAIALNQDYCTLYTICYSTLKLAYSNNLTNINCYGCNIIDFSEIQYVA